MNFMRDLFFLSRIFIFMREVVFIKHKKTRTGMIFIGFAALGCMIYSLVCPQPAAASASRALRLCAGSVVPSLIVFIIAAKMLAGSGIARKLAGAELPKRLFGVSGGGLLVMTVGFISGYPAGSAAAAELVANGSMSEKEAGSLLPFTNNAGPAFLTGAVGAGMFGDVKAGIIMLAAQTLSSFALIFLTKNERLANMKESDDAMPEKTASAAKLIASSIAKGGSALVSICAFVTFFTVVSDAVNSVLMRFGANNIVCAVVSGIFEITSGLDLLGAFYADFPVISVGIAGGIIGFSGISVMMQVFDRAEEGNVPTVGYVSGKIASAALTSLFCVFFASVVYAKSIKTAVSAAGFLLVCFIVLILIKKLLKKCGKKRIYDV